MKLVFPGEEHEDVALGRGMHAIGSGDEAEIRLKGDGIAAEHCRLQVTPLGATLNVSPDAHVDVNGNRMGGVIALRPGDTIRIGQVQARLVKMEPGKAAAGVDAGATMVRPALPKFVLRSVAGATFGKHFPIVAATVMGRAPECALHFEDSSLSRQHAKFTPMEGGLLVEDLGSTNGVIVNDKRVQKVMLEPDDEVMLGGMRFLVVSTGNATISGQKTASSAAVASTAQPQAKPYTRWIAIGLLIGVLIAAAVIWL